MSKPLSGAQKRKIQKRKLVEGKLMSKQFAKWLKKEENPDEVAEASTSTSQEITFPTTNAIREKNSLGQEENFIGDGETSKISPKSPENDFSIIDNDPAIENDDEILLNYNHPPSWPPITNKIIQLLIKHGPNQGDDINFNILASNDSGRKFTKEWFYSKKVNDEVIKRKWLIYSVKENSVFCFPCILFGQKSHTLSNSKKGFQDWKHLHPVIPQHENSYEHKNNYVKWKILEKNMRSGNMLDDYVLNSIKQETITWREVVKIIIDAILFCAKNNIALRGTNEIIGNSNSGIFLSIIELVSQDNVTLKKHIETHKKGSVTYFSPLIQNEIINIIGDKTRNEIINRIQKAKYFSILFDCTPDVSRKEQMSEIIRYIYFDSNGKVKIEESFIDFIQSHEKTGEGLTTEILNKLKTNNLNIYDVRGQGYDNGANMAGKYKGVRARIMDINKLALFVPCSAHNLNLAGVHAASTTPEMVSFFGTVQRLII